MNIGIDERVAKVLGPELIRSFRDKRGRRNMVPSSDILK
jgi:hypothetical protein